ncbi:peroxidase 4 [Quercus suber]|uniref:Peroxidase n=1 Tax=Quercus suber TaxID=58331 RepID=A0AAW0LZV7_QUESU|nr:peroxidase 4-like [Quercus suber]POE90316.1 peroxidase 4 [Quercus suber]
MASYNLFLLVLVVSGAFMILEANGKLSLSPTHYSSTCPNVLSIVKKAVIEAINKETRIGASLLRLHFHDCFVNGCDASILLDDIPGSFVGEKTANPNNNSVRGFDVVDDIKAKLEKACPGVVSCADILALAALDSVVYLGGPSWEVSLGRKDSTTANITAANTFIPPPTTNLSGLVANFSVQGLSFKNMVALSGSHTIGLARCTSFRAHIYNDSNIDSSFAKSLQQICPKVGNNGTLAPLDRKTPTVFDNRYFKNLVKGKGLLHSDQELFNRAAADSLVEKYATNQKIFFKDFAKGMVRMSRIKPLTGSEGEIRKNCRKAN